VRFFKFLIAYFELVVPFKVHLIQLLIIIDGLFWRRMLKRSHLT